MQRDSGYGISLTEFGGDYIVPLGDFPQKKKAGDGSRGKRRGGSRRSISTICGKKGQRGRLGNRERGRTRISSRET